MVLREEKMKLREEVTGLQWYQDGSTYKRNIFSSETGIDAKAVDAFVDNIVKEHNNHFEIKDPKITEELYFEIDGWNTYNGDNVYVEVNFNRDFDRDFNAEKWGEASYGGGRTEHGYVEELLNSGYLEKLGFKDAKVGGVGWNRGRGVPRWNINLYEFSDYTSDHRLKKPTSLDWHSVGNKINGTEPFTVEEGKEIRKVVCDKVVELIKKYPNEIYNCSEPGLELKVVKSRPTSISWNGSYTHNAGYFNLDIDIRDFYNSKDEMTYDADEHRFTRVLKEHCAEALNDYLADYALEIRPGSCEAHWYEGGDDSSVTYFEVSIGFKEAGLENPYDEYKKHTGLSYKDYFDEDPNSNRTFPKRPKKATESRKRLRMRSLKENTVESYWLNGGDETLKNRTPKGSFKENVGVSSNYVTPEQRQGATNKVRDYHNALMMAGLQDVDMEMERYVSNQPNERAWYNTIMNSLDDFIDSRVDEDDTDWRSYLTESKQVDECTCSGEFQRLAPVGKNTKMVNLAKKQSLGKKDKYNRLGEDRSRRLQEEEIGCEIYDFTNNDPDEDVFDVLLEVNGGVMRVEQDELDSLNIHLQNSVHGAYGLYIKGNGKPDVIINDFETGVRTPNYRYKIEVILVNDDDESKRAYSEINKYLADLLGY